MRRLIFFGKVLPERALLSFGDRISLTSISQDSSEASLLHVHIYVNQVIVTAEIEDDSVDIPTIKNRVESTVRFLADIAGYLQGHAYDVEITSALNEQTGEAQVFGVDLPVIAGTKEERINRYSRELTAFGQCLFAQRAIADLREAIKNPSDTGFHCYRAIESVMQSFKQQHGSQEDNDQSGWQRFREALNISEPWIKYLKKFGDPIRHGKIFPISWEVRKECMTRAWLVIDRYAEYLSCERQPLSRVDFPVLMESSQGKETA